MNTRDRIGPCGGSARELGASALEMALVLPMLLAFLFGLLEVGNMLFVQSTVYKAAESGARFAVTGRGLDEGTRLTRIEAEARHLADTLGPEKIDVAVRSYPTLDAQGTPQENNAGAPCELVEVEVAARYDAITPFLAELLPENMTFTARERMVNEPWAPCN